ncbi:MAG: lysylphosphatidylglycerol synthase transmembrane domain-containing protein, partial [Bacteroidales bacterium]
MQQEKILNLFSFRKIAIPILLGVLTASYLVYRDLSKTNYTEIWNSVSIQWTYQHTFYLFLAIFLVFLRDLSYIYRIRILTDKKLSWRHSFQVIMLWEFASSLTPSVVGGSAVALFIVNKEGISGGKSTAIVMVTALLDELFYLLIVPFAILIAGFNKVFAASSEFHFLGSSYSAFWIFCIGYSFIFILISIICYAIFIRPIHFKNLLNKVFKINWLKKWQPKIEKWGNDLLQTSAEMKGKKLSFWARTFGATAFSWTARFFMLNCLIMTVNPHLDQ